MRNDWYHLFVIIVIIILSCAKQYDGAIIVLLVNIYTKLCLIYDEMKIECTKKIRKMKIPMDNL
jgi:hypothetical protein